MANKRLTDATAFPAFGSIDPASDKFGGVDVSDATVHTSGSQKTATPNQIVGSVKLDDLAAPDDNTDRNATTSAHGLCPKGNGVATDFLNGNLGWSTPAGGSALPVADTTAVVKGSADATKQLRFEVDGFTTATTRVLTPPNYDGAIATLAGAEKFQAKQIETTAGTSASGGAPLKLASGTNLATPENGAIEFDGTNLYVTIGGTRYTFATLTRAETFTNKTLTTPTIGSFANAQHDHSNAAGGGQLGSGSVPDGTWPNAKLANMAQATFKMRAAGAGTGVPIDGTAAQAKTALAIATGDVTNSSGATGSTATAALDWLKRRGSRFPRLSSGRRYPQGSVSVYNTTTQSAGSSTIIYTQGYLPEDDQPGSLYVEVTTAVGGATFRLGVYMPNSAGDPGDRLFDSGDISAASTGVLSTSLASITPSAGDLWFAIRCNNNGVQFRANLAASINPGWLGAPVGASSIGGSTYTQRTENGTYGAFPLTATAAAATAANLIIIEHSRS